MPEGKKLTKRVVDALQRDPKGRDVVRFDPEIRGFGVRVKPSGAKSFILKYRNRFGQQRKVHICRVGEMTPEQARTAAQKLRGQIAHGEDPAVERRAERSAVTLAELCDQYLEAERGRIKASTLYVDRSRIDRHVKPLLGSRNVASLTPADMEKFLRDVMAGKTAAKSKSKDSKRGGRAAGGPAVAARTLGMLGTILERAVRDGILAKNPARGIKRPKDEEAKPTFSFARVEQLGEAMRCATAEGENEIGIRAVRTLLLTGCRREEVLALTWDAVDFEGRCFRLKDTKSGKQMRAVGRVALDYLASFKPKDVKASDPAFLSKGSKSGHFVGLPKVWARISKRAALEGVTVHGLRHWYASAATELGYSDLIIGALLGHAKRGITGRYATAPDPALVAAADRIAQRLADTLDGEAVAGNVITLARH